MELGFNKSALLYFKLGTFVHYHSESSFHSRKGDLTNPCLKKHCTKNAPVLSINFSQTQVRCLWINIIQFSSVTHLCPTLCDPMNHITPGLPVHHQLLESTQTHVHWVGNAIQPSHPLSSPSPALNLSQNQGLFKWVSSSHQVAKVVEFQLQHQSFQWTPRTDLL